MEELFADEMNIKIAIQTSKKSRAFWNLASTQWHMQRLADLKGMVKSAPYVRKSFLYQSEPPSSSSLNLRSEFNGLRPTYIPFTQKIIKKNITKLF